MRRVVPGENTHTQRLKTKTTTLMVLKKENSPSSVSSRSSDVPSEAPATTTTAAENSKAKKSRRRCKCFGLWRRKNKVAPLQKDIRDKRTHQKPQESRDVPSEAPATTTTAAENSETKKSRWWNKLLDLCRRKTKLVPLQKDEGDKRTHPKPQERYCAGTTKENIQLTIRLNASTINVQKWLLGGNLYSSCTEDSQQNLCNETQVDDSQEPGHQEVWLGFPNPAQICYMNSSLQSLLTLRDFVSDVSCEEEAWGILPEAVLIRSFMDIVRCHHSVDVLHKLQVLLSFKDIISMHAQEFQDISQKDAHEFLTSVLDQMRDLTPLLSETAAMLGLTYNCPVRENLVFKMQNTRMCNSCGFSSMTFEDFTHLSLNLLPGASVQEMLEEYLTETELEYRCDCGASTSWQQYRFVTLPRVLILHVKRFHFTPLLHLVKLCHPILLFRELMLTSSQANVWYTLVSVISHLGPGGNAGHYISDGVHPEVDVLDPADRWLSYNDSIVTETTGATVCKKRRKTAYILFYQRQVRERRTHPGMKLASPSPQTFSCTEEIPAFTALWQTQNHLKTEDL